jgi:predicted dehydrogenase
MKDKKKFELDRRSFVGAIAVAGAGALLSRCAKPEPEKAPVVDQAPDGPPLKAGLIGCGGRGTGAAQDFLQAGPNLQVVALADIFDDRVEQCRATLKEKAGVEIADDRCYTGFDCYKKLIDSDVDMVLHATAPHFRPLHFDYAVDAKKHVFMEKPLAVDPVGVRKVLAAAEKAKQFGLSVVCGTQRRHEPAYLEAHRRVSNGAIGRIVAARAYYNMGQLWFRPPQKGWSQMEAMIRDWVNWRWLSGDHIVEQHIHNLDTICWFLGKRPVKALGAGARMRRVTGDQFDFFTVDYAFDDQVHLMSMCRQIQGCKNIIEDEIIGTEGYTNCKDTIWDKTGKVMWQYQEEGLEPGKSKYSPYVLEHVDLVTAIRTSKPYNDAEEIAYSTLVAIMGRESAYTGQEVTWEEMLKSELRLGPTEYALGPVAMKVEVPVPGVAVKVEGALTPDKVTWN